MIQSRTITFGSSKLFRDALAVIGAALALGLVGPITIPLPFTPVPLSLTAHLILVFAVLLGPKRASLAVLGYLAQGLAGLPVFSHGGSGLLYFAGPTGGYLIGYLVAAYATGKMAERGGSKIALFGAMLFGNLLVHLFGVLHLCQFLGMQKAILLGSLPFIAGDLLKVFVATRACASYRLQQ